MQNLAVSLVALVIFEGVDVDAGRVILAQAGGHLHAAVYQIVVAHESAHKTDHDDLGRLFRWLRVDGRTTATGVRVCPDARNRSRVHCKRVATENGRGNHERQQKNSRAHHFSCGKTDTSTAYATGNDTSHAKRTHRRECGAKAQNWDVVTIAPSHDLHLGGNKCQRAFCSVYHP